MSPTQKLRIAVLASGSGSNLQAILDSWKSGTLNVEPVLVASDREEAQALVRARQLGVESLWLDPKLYKERKEYDHVLGSKLVAARVELIVLAGFMRLLSPEFIDTFADRIINIHPALLPSFPGLNAIQQAWDYGVRVTGCSVHFVDKGVDTGPIILQSPVEILPSDTVETLTAKIHVAEHQALVAAIGLIAQRRLRVHGRKVTIL